MTDRHLQFERVIRDMALEEACRIAECRGAYKAAAVIRARKSSPWTQPTPPELQRVLGNTDTTDPAEPRPEPVAE
jgi:hypothetical protein